MNNTIGKRIKTLRIERGISQAALAEKLNILRSAYERIENGKSSSWATKLVEISAFFDVPPEYFIKELPNNLQRNEKQSGGMSFQNNGTIKKLDYLSAKLIEQYEKRLEEKDRLIEFLKKKD